MNRERVVFGFFIVLALTLNFGFVLGEIDNPNHHGVVELFLVIISASSSCFLSSSSI